MWQAKSTETFFCEKIIYLHLPGKVLSRIVQPKIVQHIGKRVYRQFKQEKTTCHQWNNRHLTIQSNWLLVAEKNQQKVMKQL